MIGSGGRPARWWHAGAFLCALVCATPAFGAKWQALDWTLPGRVHGYRVRWDQIDLTDPDHPRLTCATDDLEHIGAPRRSKSHAA